MELQNLHTQVNEVDYEQAVSSLYEPLYGFAYSLSGNENDACELTQETFARLLAKSSQLRDGSRVKSMALYHSLPGVSGLEKSRTAIASCRNQ